MIVAPGLTIKDRLRVLLPNDLDSYSKKETMDSYWIPGVNNQGGFGRWAFAEMTDVLEMEESLQEKICENFNVLLSENVNHGDTENTEKMK